MKFLWNDKDGGPESKVYCWGLEIKSLFSVLLLKFEEGSREAYHNHAFDSISWVLKGALKEEEHSPYGKGFVWTTRHRPSIRPVFTYRWTMHKVAGLAKATWVLSFRGPWIDNWQEYLPKRGRFITLTHGRKEIP